MVDATISRGNTSISIPLEEESGTLLLSATFGKPEVQVRESGGTLNPRINDRWSGLESYQLVGKLFDYQTTHDLADLIKSASTTPLELEIPNPSYPDVVTVAPAAGQDTALSLSYPPGRKNIVDVELSLTRVDDVRGVGSQQATTPTATGSGPVQIRVGSRTVDLPTAGLSLERTVGRPNDAVRRVPSQPDPRYEVKNKVTNDVFTFSFETLANIPETLNALTDNIFREQLGRSGVTVDFNGVLGLGEIEAIPVGSSPFRQVHQAGQGWVSNPVLEFRRILSTS
jgi:hypothetical protein